MDERATLELCDRFFRAVEAGDLDTVRAIYAPDAVIWHNFDGLEQKPEENLRVLAWMSRAIPDRRYEDVRRHVTPTGFVQQHVLRGTAPNGAKLELEACIVCAVAGGRITRLDEYLDSAQIAPVRG